MKKFFFLIAFVIGVTSCANSSKEGAVENKVSSDSISFEGVSDKSFDDLFTSVAATDIKDNVFKLVGQDFSVITAGSDTVYNSMTASYGGWGQLFEKPVAWCFLNASRYTLELIKKEKTYTMSYFPDQFKEQVLFFGSKSGRSTDKMKENKLSYVQTPSGNISYKEARLIIECKLIQETQVHPNDFYTDGGKAFVEKGIKDGNGKEYHKLVFGEITNVWIRK